MILNPRYATPRSKARPRRAPGAASPRSRSRRGFAALQARLRRAPCAASPRSLGRGFAALQAWLRRAPGAASPIWSYFFLKYPFFLISRGTNHCFCLKVPFRQTDRQTDNKLKRTLRGELSSSNCSLPLLG